MRIPDKRAAYGDVPDHFRTLVAGALHEEEKPVKRKSIAALVIAAALVVALGATALAVGLGLTANYQALQIARRVMANQFGFTAELLGGFTESGVYENVYKGRVVRYQPIKVEYADRLGEYEVLLDESPPLAVWSHGDVPDGLDEAGLTSPVWGPKQLETALAAERERAERSRDLYGEGEPFVWPTLEALAYADEPLAAVDYPAYINVLPGDGDLTPDEAVAIAIEALREKYALDTDILDDYETRLSLVRYPDGVTRAYIVVFAHETEPSEFMETLVLTPSGEVSRADWYTDPDNLRLPAGDLSEHESLVSQYVYAGSFHALPHDERAEVGQRILDAGLGHLIYHYRYAPPDADAIGEQDARAIATQAIEDAYGITDDLRALLESQMSFVRVPGGDGGRPVWVLDMKADSGRDWPYVFATRIGEYRAIVDAHTGDVLQASWWFAEDRGFADAYDEYTWGASPGFTAEMLPWMVEFIKRHDAFMARVEDLLSWPLEVRAEYAQMFRDVGFSSDEFPDALPGDTALPEDEALHTAQMAIAAAYGVTAKDLERFSVNTSFHMETFTQQPCWIFSFTAQSGGEDSYGVILDARTGDVISAEYFATGNG